ncbi:CRISPR-associated protein, Cas2 family [Desulfonauticus submarinus]|uniref:CRISPR-associated endoribonuclease Cas2 n=1 Tax=Desulfonauticus submarinus TaxID=206665 RepID=A0A1H0DQ32_9BACT|nr:CRISPR-associated endonuclease Cas2 [Desulfonauticus submarinus]SDN72091.1 CRISPR-associated protein, Cas2 family [Desulfonauticus submarinus]
MYVIMVYDIEVNRVGKVLKIGRKYLTWVQNSVLEGELTNSQFQSLLIELKDILDEEKDSVVFYLFRTKAYFKRQVVGIDKNEPSQFL